MKLYQIIWPVHKQKKYKFLIKVHIIPDCITGPYWQVNGDGKISSEQMKIYNQRTHYTGWFKLRTWKRRKELQVSKQDWWIDWIPKSNSFSADLIPMLAGDEKTNDICG